MVKRFLSLAIIFALVFSQGIRTVFAVENSSGAPEIAVATPAVTVSTNQSNTFQGKSFDPTFPPVFDSKIPGKDIPAG